MYKICPNKLKSDYKCISWLENSNLQNSEKTMFFHVRKINASLQYCSLQTLNMSSVQIRTDMIRIINCKIDCLITIERKNIVLQVGEEGVDGKT